MSLLLLLFLTLTTILVVATVIGNLANIVVIIIFLSYSLSGIFPIHFVVHELLMSICLCFILKYYRKSNQ